MEKTPEKLDVSHNSLNKSSKSFTKENSFTQEKAHTHKHDKTKCAICQAKEQKLHKKKDSRPVEDNKKTNKIAAETKKTPQSEQTLGQEQHENEIILEKPNLTMKTMRHPSLTFLFDPLRDEHPNKPYYIDGDPKMYTPEMLDLRESLKLDNIVIKAINNFMILYQFDNNNMLSKKSYIDINYKIMQILRPELKGVEKHEEMKFTLEQDWKHDSKGKEKMSKEDLFDSLFELGDIWTAGVDNYEYGSFFDMLKMKVILEEQKNPHEVPYDILY